MALRKRMAKRPLLAWRADFPSAKLGALRAVLS